jgi:hypothetical protein
VRWLDDGIASGIESLRSDLETAGTRLWRDFERAGLFSGSTEWVSAFIAAQIGAVPEGRTLAAGVVETILSGARETGGWGYRDDVPEDCDSTAWVLLAAAATGVEPPAVAVTRSIRFIVEHQQHNGGFATFRSEARRFLDAPDRAGWFEPEAAVTSAAVLALGSVGYQGTGHLKRANRYIRQNRRDDVWESHWWNGFAYPTYLALSALLSGGRRHHEHEIRAAGRAIRVRRSGTGSWANKEGLADNAFSTSFALRALLATDGASAQDELVVDSLCYLGRLLSETGALPGSAELMVPGGLPGYNVVLRDNGRVTTACVVRALHEARKRLPESLRNRC